MAESIKTCPKCKISYDLKDFLGKDFCYKCIYKEKNKDSTPKIHCAMCKNPIGKGRRKYCSNECQIAGDDVRNKRVWWKRITIVKITKINGWD